VAKAKTTTVVSVQIVLVVTTVIAAVVYLCRRRLANLFTDDAVVAELTVDSMHVLVLDYAVGCMQLCGANVLEAMCQNNAMAVISTVGTWVVTVSGLQV
jgi:Na+-driven multidrug efflux pump